MLKDAYRITSPALGLFMHDGFQVSHVIPKGAIVHIDEETLNGDKLVEVLWDRKVVMMFTQDLRSRGEKL